MLNYNHLYYFYVTARLGAVGKAADYLRISQPSLSAQLKTFESTIDRKLFQKEGRKIQLTNQGDQVYAYCKQIFETASHLEEHLKSPELQEKRRVHIGVSDQIDRPFMADILGRTLQQGKEHLNSILNIVSGDETELLNKLKGQKLDLFLTNNTQQADGLREIISVRMPVKLIISRDLLKQKNLKKNTTFNEIFKNDEIGLFLPSRYFRLRSETEVYLRQKNLRKPLLLESDLLSVISRAVADGSGCALLPVPYVLTELKLGILSAFGPEEGLWKHDLSLLSRKQVQNDPLFDEIKNNLVELNKPLKS